MGIQRNIDLLSNQLRQIQNLKAQAQQFQQNVQTFPTQQPQGLTIQVVDNFDNISANSVSMDNGTFFVAKDGKEIQYRQWNGAGRIIKTSYLPQIENGANNSTLDDEKSKNEVSEDFTKVFSEQLNTLTDRINVIEQTITNNNQQKATPKTKSTKKEVVSDAE